MPAHQPTVAGRGLGSELRSIREEQRLSSTKVAKQLGWQQSKISKIENGKQGITPADVATLLAIYGITGHVRDRLIAKAERADEPGLVEPRGGLSRESRTLIQLEVEATSIFNLEPLLVPGLLQTPDYTRALMKSGGVSDGDTEVRVTTRMGRQALLSRSDPPMTRFIVDEGVLRRPMLEPRLMARQLRHIIESTERPNVTIQVLPASLGGHNGLDESFTLLEFPKDRSVVYLDHKISGVFLEEEHEVAFYNDEVARLKQSALSPEDSVDLIASIAKSLEHG